MTARLLSILCLLGLPAIVAASPAPESGIAAATKFELPVDLLKMRDPFKKPMLRELKVNPKTELETIDIEALKLLGVMTGPRNIRAMLLGPEGKTHFITVNTKIGKRNGVVTNITETGVKVREQMTNIVGETEYIETEIRMPIEKVKR